MFTDEEGALSTSNMYSSVLSKKLVVAAWRLVSQSWDLLAFQQCRRARACYDRGCFYRGSGHRELNLTLFISHYLSLLNVISRDRAMLEIVVGSTTECAILRTLV